MVDHKGTIVITGRGGTGKSTFSTLFARYLGEKGVEPILMVDSDPDMSLAEMLGVDLAAQNKRSIADVLSEILEQRKMTKMSGMTPTEKIEPFLLQPREAAGEKPPAGETRHPDDFARVAPVVEELERTVFPVRVNHARPGDRKYRGAARLCKSRGERES